MPEYHNTQLRRRVSALMLVSAVVMSPLLSAADVPNADVDAKVKALLQKARSTTGAVGLRGVALDGLAVVDEAIAANDYANAMRAATTTAEVGTKSGNPHIGAICARRKDEVTSIVRESRRVTRSMDKLAKTPRDQQANLDVGIFYCLTTQEWDRGLKGQEGSGFINDAPKPFKDDY